MRNPAKAYSTAFLALHTRHPVYAHYEEGTLVDHNKHIPLLLMIMRWDGYLGFPGGKVEDGESPLQAALREAYEEVGASFSEEELSRITFHEEVSDLTGSALFSLEVPFAKLKHIQKHCGSALHGTAELAGVVLMQVATFETSTTPRGLPVLRQHAFAHNAKAHFERMAELIGQ